MQEWLPTWHALTQLDMHFVADIKELRWYQRDPNTFRVTAEGGSDDTTRTLAYYSVIVQGNEETFSLQRAAVIYLARNLPNLETVWFWDSPFATRIPNGHGIGASTWCDEGNCSVAEALIERTWFRMPRRIGR